MLTLRVKKSNWHTKLNVIDWITQCVKLIAVVKFRIINLELSTISSRLDFLKWISKSLALKLLGNLKPI